MKRVVVIGGGSAAGAPAAFTAKIFYKDASVTLVKREEKTLVPCGIPYIFGTLKGVDDDVFSNERYKKRGLSLVIDAATKIDRERKVVKTAGGREISYDKLVLATGSSPIKPPIEGSDLKNVFFVEKNYEYIKRFLEALSGKKKAVIIGGGFVGVELGDELRKRGLEVSIVELMPHCLQTAFDDEFCELAESKLKERGIKVFTGCKVESILGDEMSRVRGVKLDSGEVLEADVVVVTVGLKKEVSLATDAGLEVDERYGVVVDEYQRTSDEDIFAVGDCAFKRSFFTNKPSMLMLAPIGSYEARIAGANLFKLRRRNEGVIGTFSTAIGDLALAVSGLTEKAAEAEGIKYVVGSVEIPDKHPPTMPGIKRIRMKLLFDAKTETVIGGQLSGGYVVGEIANIIGTMIRKRMTVDEAATAQVGTHPLLTAPPAFYHIMQAAENARVADQR
ncbi:MAG: Dihydrolipoamide dehydrogenasecomponent of pyruvate/2-oxoglutarate dehydrogenase complex [Candidatus Alkanophagales archaeon MCA70_species_2]|nr:Dihydrolipoamide dehydrogenasecomponent of pyruvate/2-oxoglutarate dehydrogenase complex [Candidatus Alkanophaga liquidiphilum]